MTPIVTTIPNAQAVRAEALASTFVDWPGHDGEVYKRICMAEIPGLRAAIEAVMGPVDVLGMAYRLNYGGELPNAAIHSDMGWGTHAAVLYLSEGEGGTAFWRHRATGAHRMEPGDMDLFEAVRHDWDDASRWDMTGIAEMQMGRVVIYDSSLFHSRWPFAAFGTNAESGRLVGVCFFTPES